MAWFSGRDAKVELERLQVEFMREYCPAIRNNCVGSGVIDGKCKCYDPGRVQQYLKERAKNPDTQWAVYGPSCCNPVITGDMYVTVEQQ